MPRHFDFVALGGGSAGYAAAQAARLCFERVAIVDGAPDLGGLCILKGCMPSKTVIYSAEVAHLAQHAAQFGLRIPTVEPDMPALLARKRAMVQEFQSYRLAQLQSERYTLIRDQASFVDEHRLRLVSSGEEITADYIVIATGSVVNWPRLPGLAEVGALTSDDVLELDYLPRRTLVLGGGVVACEMAQYLQRLGSQVTLIQRSPLILKEASEYAGRTLEEVFTREGMKVCAGTNIRLIERLANGNVRVTFDHLGETCLEEAEVVVNALGRVPNLATLNLEAAGVKTGPDGKVRVNRHQQTSAPHIYAAGDVCGPYEIVHLAVLQGEIAGKHASGQEVHPLHYAHKTSVIFTDPQVASAGYLPAELDAMGLPYVGAEYPFGDHGKSILMHATAGRVAVWAEKGTGRVLGAECVSKDGGELIHALAVGITLGATAEQLARVQWYHPTLAEIWSYPLEEVAALAKA